MNRTLIFTVMASILMTGQLSARQLEPSEALSRAEMFVPKSDRSPLSDGEAQQPLTLRYTATNRTADMNTVYVFGRGENGGFMVVAADDAVSCPLLGYSDSGSFSAEDMPPAMKWWLEQYSSEISLLANGAGGVSELQDPESDTREAVEPIVKTTWGQTTPYNDHCPVVNGVRCPSGCVATAMAQVMSVYKYPDKGAGEHSYTPYDVGRPLTVNFANTTFEWDKMLDSYNASSPADAEEAVATLMYALGVSVSMQYTPTSSGGSFETAAVSLVKYLTYDDGIQVYDRDYYELERWINALYAELQAGRPVLYGGRNAAVAHAFVIDGYRTGEYFHLNWGWDGASNGYFMLSALNPAQQGVGGSAEGYNRGQIMVTGIQPPVQRSTVVPRILLRGDLTTVDKSYIRGAGNDVTVQCNLGFICQSVEPMSVYMGVKCVNTQTGDSCFVTAENPRSMSMDSGIINYSLNSDDFPQDEGTYNVTSGYRTAAGEWHDCLVRLDRSGTMLLTVTDVTLTFAPVDNDPEIAVVDFQLASPVYSGKPVLVNASIKVEGRELLDDVRPVLLDVNTNEVVASGEVVEVNVPVGETIAYSWEGNLTPSFATGNYKLQLKSSAYGLIGPSVDVTVNPTPTEEPVVTGTVQLGDGQRGRTADDVAYIGTNAHVLITVTCEQGYFASPACAWIYYNDTRQVRGLGNKFICLDKGQTYKREFDAWFGDLEKGHVYQIRPWALSTGPIGAPIYFQVGTSGIEEVSAENVGIWPNPAVSVATLHSAMPVRSVAVYALSGALCGKYDGNGATSVEINVGNLTSGIYVVKAELTDGTGVTYKLVKR